MDGSQARQDLQLALDGTASPAMPGDGSMEPSSSAQSPAPSTSGGRTRRTGLLTVMERPPGLCSLLIIMSYLACACMSKCSFIFTQVQFFF